MGLSLERASSELVLECEILEKFKFHSMKQPHLYSWLQYESKD